MRAGSDCYEQSSWTFVSRVHAEEGARMIATIENRRRDKVSEEAGRDNSAEYGGELLVAGYFRGCVERGKGIEAIL